jgi:hypothetical protein
VSQEDAVMAPTATPRPWHATKAGRVHVYDPSVRVNKSSIAGRCCAVSQKCVAVSSLTSLMLEVIVGGYGRHRSKRAVAGKASV